MHKTISILGATGSIGKQTLDVVQGLGEGVRVRWITCNTRVDELARLARHHRPYGVAIREEGAWARFKELYPEFSGPTLCGEEGLCEAAADSANTLVMSAMVGFSGVVPTLAAIQAGHDIALANKESLVSAGQLITAAVAQYGVTMIPVDSEHSAIAQCLVGEDAVAIEKIILTASGGPFREASNDFLESVSVAQALQHPNWDMGAKITIDSATLMNKGFEVIEAHWLFNLPAEKIEVVIHPQSIIHSMVEFVDGSVKAQMGMPTMLVPIQYALTQPRRQQLAHTRLSLADVAELTFSKPDVERFPCLQFAYNAMAEGGTAGCILNAANEIAVHAFLEGKLSFTGIPRVIEQTIERMKCLEQPSLAHILAADAETRSVAQDILSTITV